MDRPGTRGGSALCVGVTLLVAGGGLWLFGYLVGTLPPLQVLGIPGASLERWGGYGAALGALISVVALVETHYSHRRRGEEAKR